MAPGNKAGGPATGIGGLQESEPPCWDLARAQEAKKVAVGWGEASTDGEGRPQVAVTITFTSMLFCS